jgi:hypothetical protein
VPDSDNDGDLRRAFADTGAFAERHTDLPGPDRARRTARRRSAATATGAAALTLLAVVGSVVGVSRLDGPSEPLPAAPAPTTVPAGPTAAPTVPTTIPGDLEVGPPLSDDGEVATRDVQELPVDVCPGGGIPGVDTATDRRLRLTTGPEYAVGDGLLVFADADGAVSLLGGLREAALRCAAGVPRPEGGTREVRQEPLPGPWGEGVVLLVLDVPDPGGEYQPVVGSYLLAVRTGSAVALRYAAGELLYDRVPAGPDPDIVGHERASLDTLAPELCRWTVAGC